MHCALEVSKDEIEARRSPHRPITCRNVVVFLFFLKLPGTFPTFVPSLSWQMFVEHKMARRKDVVSMHTALGVLLAPFKLRIIEVI
jgi:hypothetical protein